MGRSSKRPQGEEGAAVRLKFILGFSQGSFGFVFLDFPFVFNKIVASFRQITSFFPLLRSFFRFFFTQNPKNHFAPPVANALGSRRGQLGGGVRFLEHKGPQTYKTSLRYLASYILAFITSLSYQGSSCQGIYNLRRGVSAGSARSVAAEASPEILPAAGTQTHPPSATPTSVKR